jgi:hypothetical protein
MARGIKDQSPLSDDQRERGGAGKRAAAPGKLEGPPSTAAWFEEAWHGWLKPVGGLVLLVAAYLAYNSGALPEQAAGRVALGLILGGAVFMAIEPALGRLTTPSSRYLLVGFGVVWLLAAIGPVFRTVFPSKVLAETTLGATKGSAAAVVNLEGGGAGPYEVAVSGHLRGTGEVDAAYEIEVVGAGDTTDRVQGDLKRTYFNQRVSRRGSGSVAVKQENTENVHRLSTARGPQLKVSGEVGSEMLEDGVHLTFRSAGPSPLVFLGLGLLLVIGALAFDYRMAAPKHDRTHLSTATGFTLAFGAYFPMEATPHNLVRPAIAAVLVGLGLGALLVWVVSAILNSFKPRPKKLAGVNNRFAEE